MMGEALPGQAHFPGARLEELEPAMPYHPGDAVLAKLTGYGKKGFFPRHQGQKRLRGLSPP